MIFTSEEVTEMKRRKKTPIGRRHFIKDQDTIYLAMEDAHKFHNHCYRLFRDKGPAVEQEYVRKEAKLLWPEGVEMEDPAGLKARVYYTLAYNGIKRYNAHDLVSETFLQRLQNVAVGIDDLSGTETFLRDSVNTHYYSFGNRADVIKEDRRMARKNQDTTVDEQPKPGGSRPRLTLFGKPITQVLRWMGREGYSAAQATVAMERLSVPVAQGTINTSISNGQRDAEGLKVAVLDPSEIKELRAAIPGGDLPEPRKSVRKRPVATPKDEEEPKTKAKPKAKAPAKRKRAAKVA